VIIDLICPRIKDMAEQSVEVIVRAQHLPGEELFRTGRHPIPEAWLGGKPVGSAPGGSEEEQFAALVEEMDQLIVRTMEAARKSA
jgi:hypothetical protein